MIFGSLIPSAKAITDPTTNSNANAQIREIFIDVFLFTKGILLGNRFPALGECGEGSSFSGTGQAEISISSKYIRGTCKLLRTANLTCANLCTPSLRSASRAKKKPEPEGPGCPVGCVPG